MRQKPRSGKVTKLKENRTSTSTRSFLVLVLTLSMVVLAGITPSFGSSLAHHGSQSPITTNRVDRVGGDPSLTPTIGWASLLATVTVTTLPLVRELSGGMALPLLAPGGGASSSAVSSTIQQGTLASVSSSSVVLSPGFDGLNQLQSGRFLPPDVQVAAGPNHVVEMVNLEGQVFSKQGSAISSNFTLASFFHTGSDRLSDPKLLFDASTGRWFASIIDITASNVTIAVSATNDPTGIWKIYGVNAGGYLPDQPIIGISDDKLIISANDFDLAFNLFIGAQYWVLNKSEMLGGTATVDFSSFGPDPTLFSVHPAQSLSPTTTQYMVMAGFSPKGGVTNIAQLFSITGTPPGAVVVNKLSFSLSSVSGTVLAPQPGTNILVNTNDNRVLDAAWFQGKLWFAFNDGCIPLNDNQTRSCFRLTQIDTTVSSKTQDFEVGAKGQYYFYPALRIDGLGNLGVVFGYSSATNSTCCFPSLAVTGQSVTDPVGSLAPSKTLKLGSAIESSVCSMTVFVCRYGDYFGAGVDPSDLALIWVAGEYHNIAAGNCGGIGGNCWSTFIGSMRTIVGPDFGIDPSPGTFTSTGGSSGTSTITLASLNNFAGNISLTTSISPAGPTASLSSSTVTLIAGGSGTSTLAIQTPSNLASGTYTITVKATSGSQSHSATLTVNIPGFAISANPGAFSLATRSSSSSTLTITSLNGFNGNVGLTTAVSPPGPSTSLSSTSVAVAWGAQGTSTLTVSTTRSTPTGLYIVTVTGASGAQSSSMSIGIVVTPLSVTISNSTTFTGIAVQTTGSLSIDSPSGALTLSGTASVVATNASTGTTLFSKTYTITQLPVSRASSGAYQALFLLNIAVSPYPLSSDLVLMVAGTSIGATVRVTREIDINGNGIVDLPDANILKAAFGCSIGSSCYNPLADLDADGAVDFFDASTLAFYFNRLDFIPDFSISASISSQTINIGSLGTATITLTSINGFEGTVNLAAPASPTGLTTSLSPTSATLKAGGTGTSTLTVSSPSVGTFAVNATGSNGPLSHSVIIAVKVVDFVITSDTANQFVPVGSSFNAGLEFFSVNGFTGTVKLTAASTPSTGIKLSLNTTSIPLSTNGVGSAFITISPTKIVSCFDILVTGTTGSLSHSIDILITSKPGTTGCV